MKQVFRPKTPTQQRIERDHGMPWQDVVASLYEAGRTMDEIGHELGTNRQTVANLVREAGVTPRPRGPRRAA